jgi:Tfp pilus assembly protein FimT
MTALTLNTLVEQGLFNADTLHFISKTTPGNTPITGTKIYSLNGKFSWVNSDGFSRTLSDSNTASRTYTLPNLSDTIAVANFAQTFANKTLTSSTNDITAKGVFSATTTVNTSANPAPTTGQILTALSSTSAGWSTPASATLTSFIVNSATTCTTNSTSYVSIDGMSITPTTPGAYLVIFSASAGPSTDNQLFYTAVFLNGSIVSNSERRYGDTAYICIRTSTVVNWTAGTIEARMKTSGQNVTINKRSLIAIKIG